MVEIDFHAIQILKCGTVNLELRCPQRIDGIAVNPDPYWKFDALILELKSLETRLNISAKVPAPFVKARSCDFSNEKGAYTSHWPFVIHASDDFDGFDDESDHEFQSYLMGEVGSVEGVLCELTHEHELDFKDPFIFTSIEFFLKSTTAAAAAASSTYYYQIFTEEEIRNKISALETDLMGRSEKSSSALTRVERYQEARWEIDRKLDAHYQRKIAEALDYHLSAVQWDHELRSQIEERKIRSDAAYEEAKRKEKALQEEKVRQEKAKVESEARLRAEEAKSAALEAERREAKEAAEREAIETSTRAASGVAQEEAARSQMDANSRTSNESKGFASDAAKKSQSASNVLRAAESALNLEQGRLQKFKEIDERNQALRLTYNKDFSSFERHIARLIRQISRTKEIVSEKSHDIFKIFNDPLCPQSISIAAFAKKVVSRCESPEYDVFACGHVIVLVTSQVPLAMDLLLAELHRACIYTVPKHIIYSKSAFKSKEAYYKAIGYKERDGKIESIEDYLKRLDSYMRLYGALIQTEVEGVQNLHGLKEGWAWIARFLNTLPANRYTAVALYAFLQMAGFALFRKYKSQFMKMLSIISNNFLEVLKAREESGLRVIILEIQSYMEDKRFLKEPEGRALQGSLLSSVLVPEQNYQHSYHHQPPIRYSYY